MTDSTSDPSLCPLCGHDSSRLYHQDRRRPYWQCQECRLVYVPPAFLPTAEEEKAEYDLHDNRPDDPGYRRFLSRLFQPMVERLPPAGQGLDFGCGPGPTLSVMFQEAGFSMDIYDPFYAPSTPWISRSYDFITATEVVEHLHQPGRDLETLWQSLKPGGLLGIMTKRVLGPEAFAGWHYKNDRTHVSFFSEFTFQWWGRQNGCAPEFPGNDTVILAKRPKNTH